MASFSAIYGFCVRIYCAFQAALRAVGAAGGGWALVAALRAIGLGRSQSEAKKADTAAPDAWNEHGGLVPRRPGPQRSVFFLSGDWNMAYFPEY